MFIGIIDIGVIGEFSRSIFDWVVEIRSEWIKELIGDKSEDG